MGTLPPTPTIDREGLPECRCEHVAPQLVVFGGSSVGGLWTPGQLGWACAGCHLPVTQSAHPVGGGLRSQVQATQSVTTC